MHTGIGRQHWKAWQPQVVRAHRPTALLPWRWRQRWTTWTWHDSADDALPVSLSTP